MNLTDQLTEQFENLFGSTLLLRHSPDPTTPNARGIAIILNKRMINTNNVTEAVLIPGRAITIRIPWHGDQHVNILAIYAPNIPGETRRFWREIRSRIEEEPELKPDIMLGDFNLVEDAIDRIPSRPDDPLTMESLREFKIKYGLVDGWRLANPEEKGYTWSRESDGTQSRIDRIYVHNSYFNDCAAWEIEPAPVPTDHDLVSALISTPSAPEIGKGRWAIPTRLTKNREMKKEIQRLARELQRDVESLRGRSPQNNAQMALKRFKTEVRDSLRRHEKKHQPMIKNKIAKLTESLRDTLNNANLPEEEVKITAAHLKKEIQLLYRDAHHKSRDILAAVDAAEGERIGKAWSNRHKENKPRDTIKCIVDPNTGIPTKISKEMAEIAASYHDSLQHEGHDPPVVLMLLVKLIRSFP